MEAIRACDTEGSHSLNTGVGWCICVHSVSIPNNAIEYKREFIR
jgi:hypothetical protein